ncbi:unnamed protein product [Cylindrotheca closterium]|uniref:Uncharacterized protein n=1 Tax=Cylindrotheca closterium TaxID=2856 RepID=A0AAD2GBK5_9STRA|nr:unnamed protein product [Cylindrotheca closterium]
MKRYSSTFVTMFLPLLLALVVGPSVLAHSTTTITTTTTTTSNTPTRRRQLQDQQALFDEASAQWTSYGDAVDYNFAYLRQDETFPQFQVTVRNSTTIGVDTVYGQPQDRYVFTMDQLLGYISESLSTAGDTVAVNYDKTYGYPTSWNITGSVSLQGTMESFTFFSILREQLNQGKAVWDARPTDSYDYTIHIIGFLPPPYGTPKLVQVRNGTVETILEEDTGEMIDMTTFNLPTIDQAFQNIENALTNYYATVDATFDPTLGYPMEYSLRNSIFVADGNPTYRIYDVVLVAKPDNDDTEGTIVEWQNELATAKALWSERNLSAYNYTFQRFCECPPEFQRAKLVQVVDGDVVAIDGTFGNSLDEAPTLDGLFTIIEAAIQDVIRGNVSSIRTTYDAEYGYPASVFIDYDEMMADEEYIVSATLEEVNGGGGGDDDKAMILNEAKTKWESMGLSNYHFGIVKECRCVFRDPIAIQVSNGEVAQMRNRFGDEVDQDTTGYSLTIEDIFGLIQTGMDEGFSTVDVEYDEEYGYPKKAVLDPRAMTADDEYTLTIDYLAPLTKWQNELEAGKRLWSEQNIKSYNYTYQRSCECLDESQLAKLVQVVDGDVVTTGDVSAQATQRSSLNEAPTLDGLFVIIQDGINRNAFRIVVDYDPKYGYPTSVYIDYYEMIADEEYIVSAVLVEVNDGGANVDPVPDSSAPKTAMIMGHLGLASLLLCMQW